ncbi:hypothetical protein ABIB80_004388 [Bradyrhizobium sp. i1.15.2]
MPRRLAIALLLCLAALVSSVLADDVKTNTFDRHELTLTNGSNNEVFGWIELLQGNDIAGYLYVTGRPPREPYLSADKKYIVMDFLSECWMACSAYCETKSHFKSDSRSTATPPPRPLSNEPAHSL